MAGIFQTFQHLVSFDIQITKIQHLQCNKNMNHNELKTVLSFPSSNGNDVVL